MSETKDCAWCAKPFNRPDDTSNAAWTKTLYCSRSCGNLASFYRSTTPAADAAIMATRADQVSEELSLPVRGVEAYLSSARRRHPCVPIMPKAALYRVEGSLF